MIAAASASAVRARVTQVLKGRGYTVRTRTYVRDLIALCRKSTQPVLVVLVLPLDRRAGSTVLATLRDVAPRARVVVAGRDASLADRRAALAAGADGWLPAPIEAADLLDCVGRTVGARATDRHCAPVAPPELVAGCSAMRDVVAAVGRLSQAAAAGRPVPVLLTGETGTGKTELARWIHRRGPRRHGPFERIDCAELPAGLLEDALFGHVAGAYTDARTARSGLLEAASGGTVLLDEIGELEPRLQAKLLAVLDEGRVRPLGSAKALEVGVQVIAATQEDPRHLQSAGRLRRDLYYRLAGFHLHLPPLRERGPDRITLAEALVARHCAEYGVAAIRLSSSAKKLVVGYPWPGNVRELGHVLLRAVLTAAGTEVGEEDLRRAMGPQLPATWNKAPSDERDDGEALVLPPGGVVWADVERAALSQAYERAGRKVSEAARLLGMSYHTFRYRAARHGVLGSGSRNTGSKR